MASTDTLITDYIERLRRATADLPAGTRAELVDDITAHLADTVGEHPDEAHVRQVIDELGRPEAIADAARAESGGAPARGNSGLTYDVSTVLVLLLGGFVVPVLGWVGGVVMLWNGPRWTTRDRWLGTFVWPMTIVVAAAGLLAGHNAGSNTAWGAAFLAAVVVVVVGFPTAFVLLLRRAGRRRRVR